MSKAILSLLAVTIILGAGYVAYKHAQHSAALMKDIPTPVYDLWTHWKEQNGKHYGGEAENQYRLSIFAENYESIKAH